MSKWAAVLDWFCGVPPPIIARNFRMSVDTFYRYRNKVIDGIIGAFGAALQGPWDCDGEPDLETYRAFARPFNGLSNSIFRGCIGAIDGTLVRIRRPRDDEIIALGFEPSVKPFMTRKHFYGMNCLAVCDAHCRFTAFFASFPGCTGDSRAFENSLGKHFLRSFRDVHGSLYDWITDNQFFMVGDPAFGDGEAMWVPISGNLGDVREKRLLNFYQSSLRMRIEMAFGMLKMRFAILRKEFDGSLRVFMRLMRALAILHNLCISDDESQLWFSEYDQWVRGEGAAAVQGGPDPEHGLDDWRVCSACYAEGHGHGDAPHAGQGARICAVCTAMADMVLNPNRHFHHDGTPRERPISDLRPGDPHPAIFQGAAHSQLRRRLLGIVHTYFNHLHLPGSSYQAHRA